MTGPPPEWSSDQSSDRVLRSSGTAGARPVIALTVGDAAGVGPELALRVAADPWVRRRCRPVVYGPAKVLRCIAQRLSLAVPNAIVDGGNLDADGVIPGQFSAATGRASFTAVTTAIDDALAGRVDAVVTGPIQKEAWRAAGIDFPGHTELFAERTGTDDYAMMLVGEPLACVLVTIHIPLADVPSSLSTDEVLRIITLAAPVAASRSRRYHRPPTIAVLGLNPHAGENGMMSHGEEDRIITPAIEAARQRGIDVDGPLPPDTAFTSAARNRYSAHVCMYHDQGLIAIKTLCFETGINVTLGLPIVRTSVDHGTAMDLAGRGVADPSSMIAAITEAALLVR